MDKGYLNLPQKRGVLPVRDSYPALRGRLLLRDAACYQPILDRPLLVLERGDR